MATVGDNPKVLIADKCYDSDAIRADLIARKVQLFIPLSVPPTDQREEHGPALPQERSLLDADHPGNRVLIARRSTIFLRLLICTES